MVLVKDQKNAMKVGVQIITALILIVETIVIVQHLKYAAMVRVKLKQQVTNLISSQQVKMIQDGF